MKVFYSEEITPLFHSSVHHWLPFEFEKDNFEKCTSLKDCEIIPTLSSNEQDIERQWEYIKDDYNGQLIAIIMLFHSDEIFDTEPNLQRMINQWASYGCRATVVHTNMNIGSMVSYDIMFNRQKAYFTDYGRFDLKDRMWSWDAGESMYQLADIEKTDNPKHMLCPNRIYYTIAHPRMNMRKMLGEVVYQTPDKVHFSDPQHDIVLEPEDNDSVFMNSLRKGVGGTWWPVANSIYNDSYISAYVETITLSNTSRCVTEKTWDPLIKGHFILPFAFSGFITELKNRGFLFPAWIDYSYDNEPNDTLRLQLYLDEVKRILEFPSDLLRDLYNNDKHILEHNRSMFWRIPYDSLYEKLVDKYNTIRL